MSVSGFLQSLIMTGHSPGTITIRASIRQTVGTSQKFASGNHVTLAVTRLPPKEFQFQTRVNGNSRSPHCSPAIWRWNESWITRVSLLLVVCWL